MEHSIPNLISVADFVEQLNKNSSTPIGPKAVYHLIQQPGFPAITIGYRYYIMIDRVDAWMMEQASRKTNQTHCEVTADGQ